MALSQPRIFFGVHSVTPYNRSTGMFYGELRVLAGSSLTLEGELIELSGGSAKYPWAVEDGPIAAELSLKFAQYEDFLFELFLGKAPTSNSAESSGNVSTLTNKYGTSLMHATTGVASVAVITASKANLKFGKYVVKAVSATTVDVYFSSDLDMGRGTNGEFTTDGLKIYAAQTITASSDTNLTSFGLKLTGGSGTIGMTTGDTATFSVRPINSGSTTVRVGSTADTIFPEFGAIVYAQKRGNDEMLELDLFRCKASGMPINFEQNAFSEAEVKVKVMYDSVQDGIFDITHVKGA